MRYAKIREARFISRPNRFIAQIEIDGRQELAHVKNTGRCRELLLPGAAIFVQEHDVAKRKTKYSLIAVYKGSILVNMDSQAPNKVVQEWLLESQPFGPVTLLKPECTHGASRFDFYLETPQRKMFIEVKGVTLEENGAALFPDAPTERGVKHVLELCDCMEQGYEAAVIFVVQMAGMRCFQPNRRTQPEFAEALLQARQAGVQLMALGCDVTPDSLEITAPVPVQLEG
mgnify:CR=1 FL=1